MKWTFLKNRYFIIGMLFFFFGIILISRLMVLQIRMGEEYGKMAERLVTRVIPLKAPRGVIYDRNGEVLAWHRPSFNVEVYRDELHKGVANDTILTAINIIERNNDSVFTNLPITIVHDAREGKAFKFDFGDLSEEGIAREKARWTSLLRLEDDISASEAFERLRQRYNIGDEFNDYEAIKILNVWNEIVITGFRAFEPVTIARDVNTRTVASLEELYSEIPGIVVSPSYVRFYPHGNLASHVIGYIGRITAEEWEANREYYESRRYNPATDLIGRWEMEQVLEPYLKGDDGGQRVQVDVMGRNVRILERTEPIPGNDVFLTLDLNLQRAAENGLRETMEKIRTGEIGDGFPNALVGSAVVIDVNTGAVLALANEPSYDPNFSVTGQIDPEIWREYNPIYKIPGDPEREDLNPTLPRPMANNAVRGIYPPGSTYKMLVAVAALEEGIVTPQSIIVDRGQYTKIPSARPPACWIWNQRRGTHGAVDVISSIRDSCNYYYYEIGNRMGIEKMEEYAQKFGFGERTGIELPGEARGIVAGKTHTNDYLKSIVRSRLINLSEKKWNDMSEEERDAYRRAADIIVENPSVRGIQDELENLELPADTQTAYNTFYRFVVDYRWTSGKTLSASIGQAENTFTPIQMANYMATLVNGGTRYKTHLIDSVVSYDGNLIEKVSPEIMETIEISEENYEAVLYGMQAVTSNVYEGIPGTAASYFRGFPIAVGGKTGSAQFPGHAAYAWFVAFAPYDDPQIAVSVVIAQGGSGGYASPVARIIFEEYFGINRPKEEIPRRNQLLR